MKAEELLVVMLMTNVDIVVFTAEAFVAAKVSVATVAAIVTAAEAFVAAAVAFMAASEALVSSSESFVATREASRSLMPETVEVATSSSSASSSQMSQVMVFELAVILEGQTVSVGMLSLRV